MSSQRGNSSRTRPQKHKNKTVFKNNLHDTSHKTKLINSIQVSDVCMRCKEIIEWKIKYKKYKPLSQPKTCVKCSKKNVKKAYHVMCTECGANLKVCTKCCQPKEVVPSVPSKQEQVKLDNEMQQLLQTLPERKRRTFIRYMNKKKNDVESSEKPEDKDATKEDLLSKLNSLKVSADDEEGFSDLLYSDYDPDEVGSSSSSEEELEGFDFGEEMENDAEDMAVYEGVHAYDHY